MVEILGRYLNVYGVGAIKFVDKQWNVQKAQDVHTVKFSYINFNSISPILGRIKVRFPNVENYVFRETNFVCLGQLNAMADTQGLKSITIDPEGNPLASKNWRTYAIYRLNHWGEFVDVHKFRRLKRMSLTSYLFFSLDALQG